MAKQFSDARWSRWVPSTLYGWLKLLLMLGIIIQGVRLFWTLLTPVTPLGDWQPTSTQIASSAERTALFAAFDPFNRQGVVAAETSNVTSLALTLFGIRMNQGSGLGSAILAGEDGVQRSYLIGEEITGGVTLDSVAFDHVIINRSGVKESLYLDQSVPAQTVGTDMPLTPAPTPGVSAVTGTPSAEAIRANVGFEPRMANGKVTGIAVSSGADTALFRAAGFQQGDVITAVNGKPITSINDIATISGQIAPGARLSLEVERGATKVPIAIIIPSQ